MTAQAQAMTPRDFYKTANLRTNPFRQNPALDTDPRAGIWVGYQKEQRDLVRYLNQSRADQVGNSNLLLLYGELGAGKTHALLWARHYILVEQREQFSAVVYHISTLRIDYGITFAGAFERDVIGKSTILNDVIVFKQYLDELCVEYRRVHHTKAEKVTIIRALIQSRELSELAIRILECENEEAVKDLLLPPKSGDFKVMGNFAALINLFVLDVVVGSEVRAWKKAVYLFIDELNLIADSSAKEQRMANELIRAFYDLCPNRFCLILALTATVANTSVIFDDWVLSRVSKQIVMQTLSQKEAKDFIAGILKYDRIDADDDESFRPFEESAIDALVSQLSSITPRRIMKTMERVLEQVRIEGFDPSSGLVSVSFLDTHGIMDEVNVAPL